MPDGASDEHTGCPCVFPFLGTACGTKLTQPEFCWMSKKKKRKGKKPHSLNVLSPGLLSPDALRLCLFTLARDWLHVPVPGGYFNIYIVTEITMTVFYS